MEGLLQDANLNDKLKYIEFLYKSGYPFEKIGHSDSIFSHQMRNVILKDITVLEKLTFIN